MVYLGTKIVQDESLCIGVEDTWKKQIKEFDLLEPYHTSIDDNNQGNWIISFILT